MLIFSYSTWILAQNKPTSTISQNYTLEIVHFVARLQEAGPEPVIALLTESADDVSEIAERISERMDEITTYPMWLIGKRTLLSLWVWYWSLIFWRKKVRVENSKNIYFRYGWIGHIHSQWYQSSTKIDPKTASNLEKSVSCGYSHRTSYSRVRWI